MADLKQAQFGIAFDFTRPLAADYRNAAGAIVEAAIDAPRFDHDEAGIALGLLVEGGPYLGQADRARLDPLMLPEDYPGSEMTVLHARTLAGGSIERRAFYTRDAKAMIDALLNGAGHHRSVGVIAGFRENKGGFVRYRGQSWYLPELLATGAGDLVGDGNGRALTGG